MGPTDISLRTQPQQARSRATFERILEAAAELLEEVGLEGFNTNLLAERAGVGSRALYRYFPNKFAVLVALAERFSALEPLWIGDLKALSGTSDWRLAVDAAIDGYYQTAAVRPGYAALRAASVMLPELRTLDAALSQALEKELAVGLRGLGVSIDDAHLDALCCTIVQSANQVLDTAIRTRGPQADLMVRELKVMIVALLERYLP